MAYDVAFMMAAVLCTLGSGLCVTRRNPIYGTLFLLVAFVGVALTFLLLASSFLAVMQILLYAGAILVLFLFVIMLLTLTPEEMGPEPGLLQKAAAFLLAGAVFVLVSVAVKGQVHPLRGDPRPEAAGQDGYAANGLLGDQPYASEALAVPASHGGTEWFGETLFSSWVLPFELVSLLVTAAIVGVMVLARLRKAERRAAGPSRGALDADEDAPALENVLGPC